MLMELFWRIPDRTLTSTTHYQHLAAMLEVAGDKSKSCWQLALQPMPVMLGILDGQVHQCPVCLSKSTIVPAGPSILRPATARCL